MKRLIILTLCSFLFLPAAFAATCESLAGLSLPHTKITAEVSEPGKRSAAIFSLPMQGLPPFCRVAATLTPSPDSSIKIEVWMPISGWNGKYEGTGNGGYAGRIQYHSLAAALRRGYAVANTDMGTAPSTGPDGDPLIGHPEKWQDWGVRATHEMTIVAKQIIEAYYNRQPQHSYFRSCSTGGEQGLMEAQRFPDDYDGIVAGAPANNRTRLHMEILWDFVVSHRNPADNIPADKLPMITQAVLHACSSAKALPSDNFLTDPSACHWDPQTLLCKAGDAADCLTAEQVETARNIYQGPINPATRESIYPGVPCGSEFGWSNFLQANKPPYDALFKWVFGPNWNWRTFDFNRDVASVDARLAPVLNATSPNLSVFKAHGHKLIVYHGWADWLVPPQESVNYYEEVAEAQAKAAESHHRDKNEETQEFYRLFMVPGMSHCSDGPGLNAIDPFPSLELWVEKGVEPKKIIAQRKTGGAIEMTRPVCPYPQSARYIGTGDTNVAANFFCTDLGARSNHSINMEAVP